MSSQLNTVGFVGIGKLGLPCAEVMAQHYDVTGFDIYPKKSDKIKISKTIEDACKNKDVIFVAVQTPHDPIYDGSQPITHLPNKDFDYTIVKNVLTEINQYCNKDQLLVQYCLVQHAENYASVLPTHVLSIIHI
jgi:UDPglucose 6-dehydrogenase